MICCCSMAGTQACYSCAQYLRHYGYPTPVVRNTPFIPPKKKITREVYDDNGNLKERIIEE